MLLELLGALGSTTVHDLLFTLQCLYQDDAQSRADHVDAGQCHGHSGRPNRLVLQVPGQLVDAPVEVGVACNSVTTGQRQWLPEQHVVVRSLCTTAANLKREIIKI